MCDELIDLIAAFWNARHPQTKSLAIHPSLCILTRLDPMQNILELDSNTKCLAILLSKMD